VAWYFCITALTNCTCKRCLLTFINILQIWHVTLSLIYNHCYFLSLIVQKGSICHLDPFCKWKIIPKKNQWVQKGTICHMIPFCTNINSHVTFLHNQIAVLHMAPNYIINYLINYRYYRPNFFNKQDTYYYITNYKKVKICQNVTWYLSALMGRYILQNTEKYQGVLIYTCRHYNYPLYHFGLSTSFRMMKPPAHVQTNSESI
jgi:hypothetical protein